MTTKRKRRSKPDFRPIRYSMAYINFIIGCLRDNLIARPGYTETHHIKPRCRGGRNNKGNTVKLTGCQHFEAHRLLSVANPTCYKLLCAVASFCMYNSNRRLTDYQLMLAQEAKALVSTKCKLS